jgi:hypothetical protein
MQQQLQQKPWPELDDAGALYYRGSNNMSRSGGFYAAAAAAQRTADAQEQITLQEVAPDISLPTEWIY